VSVVIIEDGNIEKGIRILRKLSNQHLAEVKHRYLNPKKSERIKYKKMRAERKRLSRERKYRVVQRKYERKLKHQMHEQGRQRRAQMYGEGGG
jgi:hypothetical protein